MNEADAVPKADSTDDHSHHAEAQTDGHQGALSQDTHSHSHHSSGHHGGDHHAQHRDHGGHDHHAMMVADFRRRFWISLFVTVPILLLSPMIQQWFRIEETLTFPGSLWLLLGLSSFIYFYGGWPFLTGLVDELRKSTPGMMTLVGLAISIAYGYSAAVVFGDGTATNRKEPPRCRLWESAKT